MADRAKQTFDFLNDLKGVEIVKPVYNPQAYHFRSKARAAATRGEIAKTDCKHPFAYLQQYKDEDPGVRRNGQDLNLFECGVCSMLLWLVDAFGDDKPDV